MSRPATSASADTGNLFRWDDTAAQAAFQDCVPAVRRRAAYALSRLGDKAALLALEPARLDRKRIVRTLAALALTRAAD